ncbi:hypothetical protein ACFX1W_035934 [Malus domestica]
MSKDRKSKRGKFIKFYSKIDKQQANTEGAQAKATKERKGNPKSYPEDYSSVVWTSPNCSVVTPSAALVFSTAASSESLPSTAPAWVSTPPTISPIEASKVKSSKSSGEIEKVSKSLPENSKSDGRP